MQTLADYPNNYQRLNFLMPTDRAFYAMPSRKQIKTIYESIKTYVNKTINVHLFFTAPFPFAFHFFSRFFFADGFPISPSNTA